MKGKFTRKDNSKVLTTTRTLVGGELVQVGLYFHYHHIVVCFKSH